MESFYIYNNLALRHFTNKFYFSTFVNLPQLNNFWFEFHNTNNTTHLMLVSFMDEVLGSLPVFFKKGFNYSVDGKKIFIKDLRLITGLNLLDLLKTFYIALPRRRNRCKLVKSINTYSVMLTLLCSDFAFSFYRELFLFLDTINFHLNFSVNNRFLLAYFLRNLNFC